MSISSGGLDPQSAAEEAVSLIGLGYDVCKDLRLSARKSRLIDLSPNHVTHLVFPPGGVVVPNVSTFIKCHPGESIRVSSPLLSFHQVISTVPLIPVIFTVSYSSEGGIEWRNYQGFWLTSSIFKILKKFKYYHKYKYKILIKNKI